MATWLEDAIERAAEKAGAIARETALAVGRTEREAKIAEHLTVADVRVMLVKRLD